jgi:hypothetical protein
MALLSVPPHLRVKNPVFFFDPRHQHHPRDLRAPGFMATSAALRVSRFFT